MVSPEPHRRSSSFFLPMLLMRKRKRHGLKALYYFCRVVDDAVDEAPNKAKARENLAFWRDELEAIYTKKPLQSDVAKRLSYAVEAFSLPRQPFEDLMQGMELDCAEQVRLKTEAELKKYCYCVAGTVGLQAMRIFGVKGEQADAFALTLGQALQFTNILRDVKKDAVLSRTYLPEEWGDDKLSPLIRGAEESFQQVDKLAQGLPNKPLLPALLMRDIYYWKFTQICNGAAAKPLPFSLYFQLIKNVLRYALS